MSTDFIDSSNCHILEIHVDYIGKSGVDISFSGDLTGIIILGLTARTLNKELLALYGHSRR